MSFSLDLKDGVRPSPLPWAEVDESFRVMAKLGSHMPFARDEEIYGQDEAADLLYRLLSGGVRTSRVMGDGRREIGDFFRKGDLFGFETSLQHRFAAEALQDSVVLVLKRSTLDPNGGDLERLDSASLNRDLDRAQEHLALLGRKSAREKVSGFLLDLVEKSAGETIDLPMGRQDIADYLGLTSETVSRMLSQLKATLVVSFSGKRNFHVTNPGALARLAA